jgi:ribosomal protein L1
MKEAASKENRSPEKHFDLTEEASKRDEDEAATVAARQAESDNANEETNAGSVNLPDRRDAENRVWTSSSEE